MGNTAGKKSKIPSKAGKTQSTQSVPTSEIDLGTDANTGGPMLRWFLEGPLPSSGPEDGTGPGPGSVLRDGCSAKNLEPVRAY